MDQLAINSLMAALFVFGITFLLGSVPWGLLISKYAYHKDIRLEGSGNIGTTNAMRTMGKAGGLAVFVLDFGKGLLSACVAILVFNWCAQHLATGVLPAQTLLLGVSFFGCVWGHIFSPWLGFKGGKGIAVAIGNLFLTFGLVGAILELVIFFVLVIATRYVSAGSIASALACPFIAMYFYLYASFDVWAWLLITMGALSVVWAHRGNIERLRAGNERKVGH